MVATRLYISATDAPTLSPAFDASWEVTGSAIRRLLETTKNGIAGSSTLQTNIATASNSPAGAVDVLHIQGVSAPLDSNQTISGNLKGQIIAAENNAAADYRAQLVAWVCKSDGTSRGVLYAGDAAALSSEFTVIQTFTNRKFPRGGSVALSSVNALTGDRIVIEAGARKHENGTTSRQAFLHYGNASDLTDLPEDETDTNRFTKAPWFEFDSTITFSLPNVRVSQAVAEVMYQSPSNARISQLAVEVMRPVTPGVVNRVRVVRID